MFSNSQYRIAMKHVAAAVACAASVFVLPASAGAPGSPVPYVFTNGATADATQVNANFSELQNQIAQLQAQLAALQPKPPAQAILGTYDFVALEGEFEDFGNGVVSSSAGSTLGELVFAADGTLTGSGSLSSQILESNVITQSFNVPYDGNPHYYGPFSNVQNTVSDDLELRDFAGTYVLSGSSVTVVSGGVEGTFSGTVSPDGQMLILRRATSVNTPAPLILVGIKR